MNALANTVAVRAMSIHLAISLLGLVASGCAGADPLTGVWTDPDATTQLPPELGGGLLDIDATLVLDGDVAPATFHLTMNLSALGLVDVIDTEGTYVDDGNDLTLTFNGFTIDPGSGNTSSVAENGDQCIILDGFAGTPVCFGVPQTNPYTLAGDNLTFEFRQGIAGNPPSLTILELTRSL